MKKILSAAVFGFLTLFCISIPPAIAAELRFTDAVSTDSVVTNTD